MGGSRAHFGRHVESVLDVKKKQPKINAKFDAGKMIENVAIETKRAPKMMPKWFQAPYIIIVSICLRKANFRQLSVLLM